MNRNEFKRFIVSIIKDETIPYDEKETTIAEACVKYEQGYGGAPLRKLLNQIAKDYDESLLASAKLVNMFNGIKDKYGFSESSEIQDVLGSYIDTNISNTNKDDDDGDDDNNSSTFIPVEK